jgi:hypothetical protein
MQKEKCSIMSETDDQNLRILLECYEKEYQMQGRLYLCPGCSKPVAASRTTVSNGNITIDCKHCDVERIIPSWKFDLAEREKHLRDTLPEHIMKKSGG